MSEDEINNLSQTPSRRDLLGGIAASLSTFALSALLPSIPADAQQTAGCASSENCQPAIGQELVSPGRRGTASRPRRSPGWGPPAPLPRWLTRIP